MEIEGSKPRREDRPNPLKDQGKGLPESHAPGEKKAHRAQSTESNEDEDEVRQPT